MKNFGTRLKDFRVARGFTQSQVCTVMLCDKGFYSRLESPRKEFNPSERTIEELSVALQLTQTETDELYVLAKRVPPDIARVIIANPKIFKSIRKRTSCLISLSR